MWTDLDLVDVNSFVLLLHLLVGHPHSVDRCHLIDQLKIKNEREYLTVFFRFSVVMDACSMFQVCC